MENIGKYFKVKKGKKEEVLFLKDLYTVTNSKGQIVHQYYIANYRVGCFFGTKEVCKLTILRKGIEVKNF